MDTVILVDVLDAHRRMISRQRLSLAAAGPPLVIGRDVGCDIIVNDPYAAARHAELSLEEDGTVRITDLNTVNGLILQGERVRHATLADLEDGEVQIGHSHLRMRTSADRLAPERQDLESLRSRHREYGVGLAGGLLCIGFAGFQAWVGSPDDVPLTAARNLLIGLAVLGAWLLLWVLLGRAVRSRWQWSRNAAVTAGAAAAALWLAWITDVTVFATGIPRVTLAGVMLGIVTVGVALYLHVRIATRLRRPQAAVIACVVPLVGIAAYAWFASQQHAGDVNYIAAPGGIYPPTWSRHNGIRPEAFLDASLELRDVTDQMVAEDRLRAGK
ncbi:MAG: FHA domain-containing protein [Chromatiales bacterium]|nr:FHA domain-containing protein [Chromatiales bacterium]